MSAPPADNTAPSAGSALSREVGPVKQPKGSFRLTLPVWSDSPVAPYDTLYCEVFEQPGVILSTQHLSKSRGSTFGRNAEWCDVVLPKHPSISRQHAAVVHTKSGPFIIDLYSSHGTTLQGVKLQAGRPYALHESDVARFGTAPDYYKFKGTGRDRRTEANAKPEPTGPATPAADSSASDPNVGDKRRHESDSSSSRKDVKTDSGRASSSTSGLADPKHGRIRCYHLLVKHAGSRRPSSWREEVITISKEDARKKLEGFRAQLAPLHGDELEKKFTALAKVNSDCSSAKHGGDLGFFQYAKMQPPFSKASFGLKVGELSQITETDSGVHIILRKE